MDNYKDRITGLVTELKDDEIFVFGSNLKGVHGAGAAKIALKWGAKFGVGVGLSGQTYAIPTKNEKIKTLSINKIKPYIEQFIEDCKNNPNLTFLVTEIGCGLAGYEPEDIAPMFKACIGLNNVKLPINFWKILEA